MNKLQEQTLAALRTVERIIRKTDAYYISTNHQTGEYVGRLLQETISANDPDTQFCVYWIEPPTPGYNDLPIPHWHDFNSEGQANAFISKMRKAGARKIKLSRIIDLPWHPKTRILSQEVTMIKP